MHLGEQEPSVWLGGLMQLWAVHRALLPSSSEQIAFYNCPKVQVICTLAFTTVPWPWSRAGLQIWRRASRKHPAY